MSWFVFLFVDSLSPSIHKVSLWGKDCALYMLVFPEPSSETQTPDMWVSPTTYSHLMNSAQASQATCGQSLVAILCHPAGHSPKILIQNVRLLVQLSVACCGAFLSAHLTAYEFTFMEPTHGLQLVLSQGTCPPCVDFLYLLPSHGYFDSLCYWQAKTIKNGLQNQVLNYIWWALSLAL